MAVDTLPEPWIERVIREAVEDGVFDAPAGTGEKIPDLDRPYDPGWWAKRWLERERAAEEERQRAAEMRREMARALVAERKAASVRK